MGQRIVGPLVSKPAVIAVDGPAGAGKSTVARLVAVALGFLYLDSGAMYRALALKALRLGIDLRDEDQLSSLLSATELQMSNEVGGGIPQVWLDGENVTELLRSPEVNASVSLVAEFSGVRQQMAERQRQIASNGGVVMDGRDIGTVVLPEADLKFYLTASLEARASRRQRDLEQLGYFVDLDQLAKEIAHRDGLDSSRTHAPLRRADDAIAIDTTGMSIEAVVAQVIQACRRHVS